MSLINELKDAIANNEFTLYFQPVIDLKTNKIISAEALMRWQHPKRGIIEPKSFFHIFEETDMVHDMAEWLIDSGFNAANIIKKIDENFSISINISGKLFQDENLLNMFKNNLEKYNITPKNINIEVTESVFIHDILYVSEIIKEFKRMGFTIKIDDFGAGYSSLRYLHKLDIDIIKIDKSFIDEIQNENSLTIVTAIIEMAKRLKMKVIAEGVETEAQLNCLKETDCNMVQGYYFYKPMPLEELIEVILENKTEF